MIIQADKNYSVTIWMNQLWYI